MSDQGFKIIELRAENFKRLKAIQIIPQDVNVITGKNGQGKSCVLDTIVACFSGAGALKNTEEPIRKGEKKAMLEIDLGDLLVKRSITPSGTTVTITTKDGRVISSPQAVLNGLYEKTALDPLEFLRMKPEEQSKVFLKLVGIDQAAYAKERKELYDSRTAANRRIKEAEAKLSLLKKPEISTDAEPKNADEIDARLTEARKVEKEKSDLEARLDAGIKRQEEIENRQEEIDGLIAKLEQEKATLKAEYKELLGTQNTLNDQIAAIEVPDIAFIQTELKEVATHNELVRLSKEYATATEALTKEKATSDKFTKDIEDLDARKMDAIKKADLPAGISLDENDVIYCNDIPLTQCSTAEQIKISTALAMKLNPKLRIIIIREGSLLDEESMTLVKNMCYQNDYQLWIEKVSDGQESGIIIEDGEVKQ